MSIFNKPYLAIILFAATPALAKDSPEPIGEVITKSVDLTFREPVKLTFDLKPEKILYAGNVNGRTLLANFSITSSYPYRLGIRFTPGSGKERLEGLVYKLNGKNDPNHIIEVLLVTLETRGNYYKNGWMITHKEVTNLSGRVVMNSDQHVAADTYTLRMDASAFIS
jgi:hypothetical protein